MAPKVDVYVAGFPCQPFSSAGKREVLQDGKGRGTVFFEVFRYIQAHMPKNAILENVAGLTTGKMAHFFEEIKNMLNGLEVDTGINLDEVLNTVEFISSALGKAPVSKVANALTNRKVI